LNPIGNILTCYRRPIIFIRQQINSASLFVFTVLYAYFGFNFLLFKIIELIDIEDLLVLFFFFSPPLLIGSIILFIRLIKKFNKKMLMIVYDKTSLETSLWWKNHIPLQLLAYNKEQYAMTKVKN
jgi:hypothetical protein